MELVDKSILEISGRFEVLHTFRSFNLWGEDALIKFDQTLSGMKEFMARTVVLGDDSGSSDDTTLFLDHKEKFDQLRGIEFAARVEHYLLAVILPDILGRHSFSHYMTECYCDCETEEPTIKQLDNMTFKPLLSYIRKIDGVINSIVAERLENAVTADDHVQLQYFGEVRRDCRLQYEKLKQHELDWIADQTYDPVSRTMTIKSLPWDFCFFFFCHFVNEVFNRAKELKNRGTDWQMVHHYARIARYNGRHPADRLRTILREIRWCDQSYAL